MFVALAYRLLVTVLTWLALLARSSPGEDVGDTRAAARSGRAVPGEPQAADVLDRSGG